MRRDVVDHPALHDGDAIPGFESGDGRVYPNSSTIYGKSSESENILRLAKPPTRGRFNGHGLQFSNAESGVRVQQADGGQARSSERFSVIDRTRKWLRTADAVRKGAFQGRSCL